MSPSMVDESERLVNDVAMHCTGHAQGSTLAVLCTLQAILVCDGSLSALYWQLYQQL